MGSSSWTDCWIFASGLWFWFVAAVELIVEYSWMEWFWHVAAVELIVEYSWMDWFSRVAAVELIVEYLGVEWAQWFWHIAAVERIVEYSRVIVFDCQQTSERLEDDQVWRDQDCAWSLLQWDTEIAHRETDSSKDLTTVLHWILKILLLFVYQIVIRVYVHARSLCNQHTEIFVIRKLTVTRLPEFYWL